jgi:hypothetical protein
MPSGRLSPIACSQAREVSACAAARIRGARREQQRGRRGNAEIHLHQQQLCADGQVAEDGADAADRRADRDRGDRGEQRRRDGRAEAHRRPARHRQQHVRVRRNGAERAAREGPRPAREAEHAEQREFRSATVGNRRPLPPREDERRHAEHAERVGRPPGAERESVRRRAIEADREGADRGARTGARQRGGEQPRPVVAVASRGWRLDRMGGGEHGRDRGTLR